MNIRYIHILLRTLAAMLLCGVAASCEQEELVIGSGETLPPGKYPLMFTATVGEMISRSAESDPWVDGDIIATQIGCKDKENEKYKDYPVLGRYVLNVDGSVKKSIDPSSWPYEEGYVKAWYPFVDPDEPLTKNITDQSEGYHDIDFLYAETGKDTARHYNEIIDLHFSHLMSKVSCKLVKGDGVTDMTIDSVRFAGYPEVSFSGGILSNFGGKNVWITPDTANTALLVPQDMSGKPFIKVNLTVKVNGVPIQKELIYTPTEANLEAGHHYKYATTVQKDRLEVQPFTAQWTDTLENKEPTSDKYHINLPVEVREFDFEFSSNVTPMPENWETTGVEYLDVLGDFFTISYTPDSNNCHKGLVFADITTTNQMSRTYYEIKQKTETTSDNTSDDSSVVPYYEFSYQLASPISEPVDLKFDEHIEVGDILFQDGKWAWGGISKTIYDEKWKKTPVGIVFKVGAGGEDGGLDIPSNYGWNDNREIRGYAVALNDAYNGEVQWSTTASQIFKPVGSVSIYYSGLYIADRIRKEAKSFKISNFPALQKAEEYNSKTASPKGSSGWYLPSYLQLSDIRRFFMHPQRRKLMDNAGGSFFLQTGRAYCSATELNGQNISPEAFAYDGFYTGLLQTKAKINKYYVRTVLTF